MSSTEHELAVYTTPLRTQEEKHPVRRVLVIFFHPSTSVTAMGGAEKRFTRTSESLCKRKNLKIVVWESAPSLLLESRITCEKQVLSLGFRGKGWLGTYLEWIFWAAKASAKSFSLARRVKYHAIFVANNTMPNLLAGYIASLVLGAPLLVIVHHIDTPFYGTAPSKDQGLYSCYRIIKYGRLVSLVKTFAFCIMLSLLKKATGILAVSKSTARSLISAGILDHKISISGNAVDIDLIDHAKPYFSRKAYDGVFVGRIAKEKGVFDLLRIWKKVVKIKANAKLLIIGSGLELSDVQKRIVGLGLEGNVSARGRCDDTELYGLLKSSRVFIFPSVFEGWGIAVAEALACGLPVVAYDIPALRENFGRCESVFLVQVKNSEKMASATLKILSLSAGKLCKLSRSSRSYARQFAWERVAGIDLEFLEDSMSINK